MKGLKRILGTAVITLALASCSDAEAPSQFTTHGVHLREAKGAVIRYGGIKEFGNDLDIDRDNMNDLYIVTGSGLVYHTSSRRLLNGEDNLRKRTWNKNTQEALDSAQKGEYNSL